jgi:methyl-accepting chemotaxis protein
MKKASSTGDITLKPEDIETMGKYSQINDEIGQTIGYIASFVEHITTVAEEMKVVATGDLTAEIKLLSDDDIMGKALVNIVDNLNRLFKEVNIVSNQVSTEAKRVAAGVRSLAQGAIEQTASIEELSSSFSEISSMAKGNTKTATEALDEVQKVGRLMGVCMQQMEQMLAAMRMIDEKSQSISKTTKLIDDIAFQTNILALNAAVESARAGQHGKGFAVVAEEVRNLASKSAEAAKETGTLIESNSHNVAEGNEIVKKVSESIQATAEIAQKNATQIADVQTVSARQSSSMNQVDVGINQIAQVVQKNSATAEESAAESEKISGQTDRLHELISQFKLKAVTGISQLAMENAALEK